MTGRHRRPRRAYGRFLVALGYAGAAAAVLGLAAAVPTARVLSAVFGT